MNSKGISDKVGTELYHKLTFYFGKNLYEICIDEGNYIYDYSLMAYDTFKEIEQFIGVEKTLKVDKNKYLEFENLFSTLGNQLYEISMYSDYNSDDFVPFTSEVKESLNEKYINLFKFIKKDIFTE